MKKLPFPIECYISYENHKFSILQEEKSASYLKWEYWDVFESYFPGDFLKIRP